MTRVFPASLLAVLLFSTGCGQSPPLEEVRAGGAAVTAAADVVAAAGDWPWWRGPQHDGKSGDEDPPTEWSESKHIVWQAEVPGRGHASPIVVADRVLLASADERQQKQMLLGYDRKTGKELWRTIVHEGGFMRGHQKNSHASATPACDGKRVFAAFINFSALRVTATDLEGNILWQKDAGTFHSEHGYGSSPVLYKSLVIVCGDNAGSSFLAALDRETGAIVWRTARERPGRHGNYGTPVVCQLAGKPQLLLAGHGTLSSYDPATGERLWFCSGPAQVSASTVACSDTLVFASAGYPEKEIIAVRADGSGDVSQTHVAWRATKGVSYVPSPIYHDGRLYVINDSGIASCVDAASGESLWQERLGGNFSSSPVLAGGKLFVTSETGTTHVLEAAAKFKQLGQNELGDSGFASPAIVGGQIFLRSGSRLYCIGR
jgi:outer membrane protein assembly factor BamB